MVLKLEVVEPLAVKVAKLIPKSVAYYCVMLAIGRFLKKNAGWAPGSLTVADLMSFLDSPDER